MYNYNTMGEAFLEDFSVGYVLAVVAWFVVYASYSMFRAFKLPGDST